MTAARRWVTAARPAAEADGDGNRTVLLREVLATVLSPDRREQVLVEAGWDEGRDGPADESLDTLAWIDRRLFLRLAERLGIVAADELRQHAHQVLARSCPPPSVAPPAESATVTRSGFRRRRKTPIGQARTETVVPESCPARVVFWTRDAAAVKAVRERLWPRVQVVVAPTARAAASILGVAGQDALLVVDRRTDRSPCEGALSNRRVVVWGAEGPELSVLLEAADHVVPCSAEAAATDVADLVSALMPG